MKKVNPDNIAALMHAVGGKENIVNVTHCVTRLRFQLKDQELVQPEGLENIDIVKGQFYANEQFQVVIGQGTVDKAYDVLLQQMNEEHQAAVADASDAEDMNLAQKVVKLLSDVFIPILPAIVASGLLLGLNNVLTGPGIFGEMPLVMQYPQIADFASLIGLIAGTAFAFLPVLVSWSVVKRFGGSEIMGIVLGLVLVHPDLLNGYIAHSEVPEVWHLAGFDIAQIGYQGQVLPAMAAGLCYVQIEKWLKRNVPDALQLLIVPTVSLLLGATLSFVIIGPVTYQISTWITDAIVGLSHVSLLLTGILFGGGFAILVVTGMHHAFLAVNMQLIATTGLTIFWPMQALSDLAQGSAAFVVGFLQRHEKKTDIAYSAGFSAYLGITEPAMFGVNLPQKYPFVAAMIGAASGAGFIGANAVSAPAIGVSGLLSFLSITRASWSVYIVGMVITIVMTSVMTTLFYLFGTNITWVKDIYREGKRS